MKEAGGSQGLRDADREGRWGRSMERGGWGALCRGPPPGLAGPGLDPILTTGKAGWQVEQWKSGVQETRLLP